MSKKGSGGVKIKCKVCGITKKVAPSTAKRGGKFCSIKCRGISMSKDGAPFWRGGRMDWWRIQVLKRDNFTCRDCKLRDPDIVEANHIKSQKEHPELKHVVANGETLCPNCHKKKTIKLLRRGKNGRAAKWRK